MGMMGGIARAVGGPPTVKTVSSVKNQALQGNIDQSITGYGDIAKQGDVALGDYISKYMSGQGAAQARTGQEVGSIDQFYNGAMSSQLAQLRAQRGQAMTSAADLATQQALRAQSGSRLTGSGGMGSYNSRMTIGALQPIRVQAALDNANQERADLGYVTQNQLGLAGQRNQMTAQQAGYGLVPQQQRLAMLQQRGQYLGQLGNLDQQNKFYGLQQDPNMAADILDSMDQGIMNAAAIYGSVGSPGMGGGGGGGGKARGGLIRGPGTETSDSIPTRLSRGEFVIPAEAVHMTGVLPLLERIRKIGLKHREERLHYGHLADNATFHRGMHPVHGKLMDEMHARIKKAHVEHVETLKRGGIVGYADGGLAGSAQQLGARAMADLTPTWSSPTIIGEGDQVGAMGAPGAGVTGLGGQSGGMRRRQGLAPMPQGYGSGSPANDYFTPSNRSDITPEWQQYGNYWSNYYHNPNSPGYVKPGEYE